MTLYCDGSGRADERAAEHEVTRAAHDAAAAMRRLTEQVANVKDPQVFADALHELAGVAREMFMLDRELTALGARFERRSAKLI